jgi:hypothetical protein
MPAAEKDLVSGLNPQPPDSLANMPGTQDSNAHLVAPSWSAPSSSATFTLGIQP